MLPLETKKYILDMYNRIWMEGEVPNSWKSAIIIPLLKEGKDPKDIRSYRPVALTNTLCKIFERMINKRLVWYMEKENKIDTRQFGFRKQRNTIDAISKITIKILEGFRKKEKTAAIIFDIEKTYEKIIRESTFDQQRKWEFKAER